MTSRAITIEPGSRIAVTGATGYIGTRLVPRLVRAGYHVRCLVRSPRKPVLGNEGQQTPGGGHLVIELGEQSFAGRHGG